MFFELWTENIPPVVKNADGECQSLEFYLHIHFTIYPLRRPTGRHVCISKLFLTIKSIILSILSSNKNQLSPQDNKYNCLFFIKCPLSCAVGHIYILDAAYGFYLVITSLSGFG